MRQVVGSNLWIGNAGDLRDPAKILAAGILAIVELADSEPVAILPREVIRFRFPLSDGGDNAPWLLRVACESVVSLLRFNVPSLICCSAGMSRSLCIAAAAIAMASHLSFESALTQVAASGPADVSPTLVTQLQYLFDKK
jgi:hypothetical protein